jgi:cob(I)alamin adenosyltransferase
MSDSPRVLLFTGDGKGKTTAALGMVLRAAGHGMKVYVIQFVKGNPDVGEIRALAQLQHVAVVQTGRGFLPKPGDPALAEHCAAAEEGLGIAREKMAAGQHDLVILDEICFAVTRGLLREDDVISAVRAARPGSCVVLTGRGATPGLIALADTATEMRCLKHGMQSGIQAQKGVEL